MWYIFSDVQTDELHIAEITGCLTGMEGRGYTESENTIRFHIGDKNVETEVLPEEQLTQPKHLGCIRSRGFKTAEEQPYSEVSDTPYKKQISHPLKKKRPKEALAIQP